MWNGLGYKPSLFQKVVLTNVASKHESFSIIIFNFSYFKLFFNCILVFNPVWKDLWSFVFVFSYCVGAGITTLMSISDVSDPHLFCRKMEKSWSVKEEMDGKVFISRHSRHRFPFINNIIKVLSPICTLIWSANNYVSRQGKV